MDVIHIKRLEIFANHGVIPEENTLGQKFIISADMVAERRDNLNDSCNLPLGGRPDKRPDLVY